MGLKVSKQGQDESTEEQNFLENDEGNSEREDYEDGMRCLPFSIIPEQRLPFDDLNLKRLIPGCDIQLSIQDTYIINGRSWYSLKLEHGNFRWSLVKRYRDLVLLHELLKIHSLLSIKLPEIKLENREGRRFSSVVIHRKKTPSVPPFPFSAQSSSRNGDPTWKMAAIESYLRSILEIPFFRDHNETLKFLEIGPYSFVEELGLKGKEGFITRRFAFGDTRIGIFCSTACGFWKKSWLFSKENFLALINPVRGDLECVMLVDKAFRIKSGRRKRGLSDTLIIQNLNRKLIMQCESKNQVNVWKEELNYGLNRGFIDFVSPNRYESFAPSRTLSECKWIVDGATYFDAVAIAMDAAKEEIFIADWWLTPEIYLRRPTVQGHYWQLDYLLRRKAREGVKIYVLLYKELEFAIGINSFYTEQKLSNMHPNIQVLRHPYISASVLLWAHHEKIVCIDQTHAFIGGIDLCYGRWDDFQHRLTDLGSAEEKLRVKRHMSIYPQAMPKEETFKVEKEAFKNKRNSLTNLTESIKISDVAEEKKKNLEKQKRKEQEEEKEALKIRLSNLSHRKVPKWKGILRKYQARRVFEDIQKQLHSEKMKQQGGSAVIFSPDQPADLHRNIQEIALVHLKLERQYRLWHGKDYVNFINKDLQRLDQPYSDMIDRNTTPRMPWHDVGIYTHGMTARDVARHFILRWNHAKEENCPNDSSKPYLMPKCYSILDKSAFNQTESHILKDTIGSLYEAECQVLRSLSYWSGNVHTESSIHEAYVNVIREAKSFIYIENQFFISQPSGNGIVHNEIADALFNRILRAYREGTDFRVYVILPLLPAFEGEIGTASGTLMQAITHWNYKSICRGHYSLLERLARHVKNPSKYIGFYGLRTHGILEKKLVTELIYVHSKILIADDQVAIIGSANINDRSLVGRRDSEIAVIVKDTSFLNDPQRAGKFCYSLRTTLFREHLGLMQQTDTEIDLRFPSSLDFYENVWDKIAISNTNIYEEVFHCLPSNNVRSFSDLKNYLSMMTLADAYPKAAQVKLKNIQGYLVQFPLHFLCDQPLEPHLLAKEHYLPHSIFT